MSESKHTPGPYKRQSWLVTTENGAIKICHYLPWSATGTRQEDHDTINLLAAAPDLLAALENIVGAVRHLGPCPGSLEMAEAAIKKAKGLE